MPPRNASARKRAAAKANPAAVARPRRKKRVRRKRMGSIIHVTEALICIAVLGSIGYAFAQYLTESPRFKVSSLQIEGTRVLSPEAIRAEAGITADDNLLLLQLEAARKRVADMAYVRSCDIQRAYPDRVIIRVVERVAVATLLVDNHAYEIDADGVVLRELDPSAPSTGPLVSDVGEMGPVEIGQDIDSPALDAALGVWNAFSASPLAGEWTVSEIAAPDPDSILMFCDEVPFEIRWGRENFDQQAHYLDIWWRAVDGVPTCSEYLDLRFGADLVCK